MAGNVQDQVNLEKMYAKGAMDYEFTMNSNQLPVNPPPPVTSAVQTSSHCDASTNTFDLTISMPLHNDVEMKSEK